MTMPTGDIGNNCHTCGHSPEWHEKNSPIHPFNTGQAGATAFLTSKKDQKPERGPRQMSMPFDPVLRQALIDKGVLTVEDLHAAEEKIRVVTAQFTGGNSWSATRGERPDSSTGTGRTSTEL